MAVPKISRSETRSQLIDLEDKLTRFMIQTRSTLTALQFQNNMESLPWEAISNVIWLLEDRVDDIKEVQTEILEIAREAVR